MGAGESAGLSNGFFMISPKTKWCAREDLNLHPRKDYTLNVARLPIPPLAQGGGYSDAKKYLGKPILVRWHCECMIASREALEYGAARKRIR